MPLFALEDGRAVRLPQRDDAGAPWSEETREAIQGSVTELVGPDNGRNLGLIRTASLMAKLINPRG